MNLLDLSARPELAAELEPAEQSRLQLLCVAILGAIARTPNREAQPLVRRSSDDEQLSAQQAARFLGVTVDWLYDHAEVPRHRLSKRCVRFSRRELEDFQRTRGVG